jgi:hypothetical protein
MTLQNRVNENPDLNLFLGDSSYWNPDHPTDPKYAECFINIINSFDGLREKTIFSLGNHDDEENGSNETKKQLENYFGITDWKTTKQEGNIYIICMNSQDQHWDLKNRGQYDWVKSKLKEAARLRDEENRIDWIIVLVHKPLYTLQGGHTPERKARDIYQPLFDQFQVDFVIHGHSHNIQRTLPIKYGGLDNEPVVTESGLDFKSDHGQIYIVSGAGGHRLFDFTDEYGVEDRNTWTPFQYAGGFGYHVLVFKGKKAEVYAKSNQGQTLESFTVIR